jgi:hypothetical protein
VISVHASAHRVWRAVGGGTYSYSYAPADDRMALLEWDARNEGCVVRTGSAPTW